MITQSKSLLRGVLLVSALAFGSASAFAATDTSSVPAATKSEKTVKTAKVHHKKSSHKQTAATETQTPAQTQPQTQATTPVAPAAQATPAAPAAKTAMPGSGK
jgi:hypothetical protein